VKVQGGRVRTCHRLRDKSRCKRGARSTWARTMISIALRIFFTCCGFLPWVLKHDRHPAAVSMCPAKVQSGLVVRTCSCLYRDVDDLAGISRSTRALVIISAKSSFFLPFFFFACGPWVDVPPEFEQNIYQLIRCGYSIYPQNTSRILDRIFAC
jgi:hypothetical protein